jgi:hypothetical protein
MSSSEQQLCKDIEQQLCKDIKTFRNDIRAIGLKKTLACHPIVKFILPRLWRHLPQNPRKKSRRIYFYL